MSQITAGIKLKYGVETQKGTNPTDWVYIPGITEFPEVASTPETIEDTTLDNTDYKTYIPGLKDTGGTLSMSANDTPEFRTAVKTLMSAQETAKADNLNVWFGFEVPDPIGETMMFTGEASSLGFGGAGVSAVLTTTLNVTPTSEPEWVANA